MNQFTDINCIIGFNHEVQIIEQSSILWGKNLIDQITNEKATPFKRACAIKNYVYKNISCYGRQATIAETIARKTGNCWDHARLLLFLLRLAGIPARFAYEINLKKNVFWWGKKAHKQNSGLWGFRHNDHAWVFFFDGENWQPIDSELDICGLKEFFTKRWRKISPYFFGILPYGPPFIIWEDLGFGMTSMKNSAIEIWSQMKSESYSRVPKIEWLEFVAMFNNYTPEGLTANRFPISLENAIKVMWSKLF